MDFSYSCWTVLDFNHFKPGLLLFFPKGDKFRGRPPTTLPTVTSSTQTSFAYQRTILNPKTKNDLDHLRSVAEDRTQWRRLSANSREAAEASNSVHLVMNGDMMVAITMAKLYVKYCRMSDKTLQQSIFLAFGI